MKKYIFKSGMLALFAGILLTSCDAEIDALDPSSGEADFSSYVSVGNSLTAGFSDGGLSLEGQLNSYPAIMAEQFKSVGGGEFVQPLFSEAQRNGFGYLRLAGITAQGPVLLPVTTELGIRAMVGPRSNVPLYTKFTGEVNNLGVPDMRVSEIKNANFGNPQNFDPATGRALFFPAFERVTATTQQSYLQYVQAQIAAAKPTFFSNWLGNNDVLNYATTGAFSGVISDVATFEANYTELTNVLTATGAKGVVATIPGVTSIPFFTTVGPQLKATLTAAKVPAMVTLSGNTATRVVLPVSEIKDAAGGTALIPLTASAYAPLIGKPGGKYWRDISKVAVPGNPTLGLAGLLLNYQIDTTQAFGVSAGNPWPSSILLDAAEQSNIANATTAFNNIIKAQANAKNLAIWDANAFFASNGNGFSINGVMYSSAYITGNIFSLDGVHLTPRGYALVANEMIGAINQKYGARVPKVDETQYRAVLFP